MKKIITLLGLAALIILNSCDTSQSLEPNALDTVIKDTGKINFEKLAVGQKNKYMLTQIKETEIDNLREGLYTGDTLVVEIIGKEGNSFIFEETIIRNDVSDFSDSLGVESKEFSNGNKMTYRVTVVGDSIIFEDPFNDYMNTLMFKAYYKLILPLQDINSNLMDSRNWQNPAEKSYESTTSVGFIENYLQLGKVYERLNVVENAEFTSQFAFQPSPQIYIYSRKYGIVRVITFSSQLANNNAGIGYGWDLIP